MMPAALQPAADSGPATGDAIARDGAHDAADPSRFERLDNGGRLRPGDYWRAREAVEFVEHYQFGNEPRTRVTYEADEGEVLLLVDILKDGDRDHTMVLMPHPEKGNSKERLRILLDEFLTTFSPALDGAQVREREIAAITKRIAFIKSDIEEAQRNPAYLNAQALKALADQAPKGKKSGGLPAAMTDVSVLNVLKVESPSLSVALNEASLERVAHTLDMVRSAQGVAEAQGNWMKERAEALSEATQALVPFYIESAQVAISRTTSMVKRAGALMESVSTLTLFTGENVEATKVLDGEPAAPGTGISLFQRRLFVDEEMSYFCDYLQLHESGDVDQFIQALEASPALLDLIVPAERGVVLMALSRRMPTINDNAGVGRGPSRRASA